MKVMTARGAWRQVDEHVLDCEAATQAAEAALALSLQGGVRALQDGAQALEAVRQACGRDPAMWEALASGTRAIKQGMQAIRESTEALRAVKRARAYNHNLMPLLAEQMAVEKTGTHQQPALLA